MGSPARRLDEFFKQCEPAFASEKHAYLHLIYDSEQDTKGLAQKYPDREALVEMYRDSFPLPVCDFKRAAASKSDFKRADASGTIATYGHCATKGLGTIFGFRGHLLTTVDGVPVDFVRAIASADIDDREVLRVLCDRGNRYPILLGDKGYISEVLQDELLDTEDTVLLPTLRSNPKDQYPESFRKRQVKLRRRVETTIGQLVDQFNVSDVRAH